VPRFESSQAFLVEPGDPVRDGVAALAADRPGGFLIIESLADQQEGGSTGDLDGGSR